MSTYRCVVATLALLCVAHVAHAQGSALATLELEGPLEEVWLDAGARRTRVSCALTSGERRTLVAPLTLLGALESRSLERLAISLLPEGARGQARVTALAPGRPDLFDAELSTLVTLRSRAPLGEPLARLDGVRIALALSSLVAIFALARRRWLAVVVGAAGALLVFGWPAREPDGAGVRVLEGDARLGQWVSVDGAPDRLEVPAGRPPFDDVLRREADGSGSDPSEWWVEVAPGAAPRWWLVAPGQWLYAIEELSPRPTLDARRNAAFALERCWVRTSDGAWSARGEWGIDLPLPAAIESAEPPPGWLASGLPQGIGVLLGRLDPFADVSTSAPERARGAVWLRLTSFDAELDAGKGVDAPADGR